MVVGAGSIGPGWGNGKAAAVTYAREGARVLCVDRSPSAAAETKGIIASEGGEAAAFAGDMTLAAPVEAAVAASHDLWAGVDVLHFNLGVSTRGGVVETTMEDWAQVFQINLTAALLCSRAVLPGMVARGKGALVFISSLAAEKSSPYAYVSYETSKAALQRLSASIAREYAAVGIRSNCIVPGPIDTPHVDTYIRRDEDRDALARSRAAVVPMGRQGTPWDVAKAALFLASDEAAFITGVNLRVDGGLGL
ncbi:MAG: glucose 1-dehydrogenase [Rhodospirillales bacterium]